MSEPILIWGAGAIGGTLGAAFIRAGHEVVFVDSEPEHVDGDQRDGPADRRADLRGHGQGARPFLPDDLKGTFERIFLCVKAHHTEAAAQRCCRISPTTATSSRRRTGSTSWSSPRSSASERTIGCFVNFGADYLEPGVVHYSGHGAVVSASSTARRRRASQSCIA